MIKKVTLRILDQVNCVFTGISPDHTSYFFEEYAAFVPNHFFNPKFKLGSWDGKIRYFHKTGKTYVNLLDDILPRIFRLGYSVTMIDERENYHLVTPPLIDKNFFSNIIEEDTNKPWVMRPYQVDMVNKLISNGGGVGLAGTGSGKTSMSAALAKSFELAGSHRSLIIVPDKSITDQTYDEYSFFGIDVGEYSGDRKDINHQHVVSTWQSLQNNPNIVQDFKVIIVDECLAPDTLITMVNGSDKRICDIVPGDHILSYDISTGQFHPDVVVKCHINLKSSSLSPTYEVKFVGGNILQITGNHGVLTKDGYIKVENLNGNHSIVQLSTRSAKLLTRISIATPDTTYNLHVNTNHNYIANGIVVSNCHGLRGSVLSKLLNEYAKKVPFRFGVTGTLPKAETDAMAVRIAVGNVQYNIPAHILQEAGYLAKLHIDVLQLSDNLTNEFAEWVTDFQEEWQLENPGKTMTYRKFKNSYFPDYASEKQYLQTKEERLQWIADYIIDKRSEKLGNVFCLVNGISVGKKMAKLVEGSVFLHGADKTAVRKKAYDLFKTNDNIVVFATVNIASTGLNIKRIFNLIYIDMGKSFIRTIQTIGRGLRKAPDKDSVHVTDICSDLKYSKKHQTERTKYYNEAKYKFKKHIIQYNE